jgi:hypothetical protein
MKKLLEKRKKVLLKKLETHRAKNKKSPEKNFQVMSSDEKKSFLLMDLIERMIRVEQRVALSFGKEVRYNDTDYYKSLNSKEKLRFEKYIKTKGRKKYMLAGSLFALGAAGMLSYRSPITGNVIGVAGIGTVGKVIGVALITALLIGLILLIINFGLKLKRGKSIKKNFQILEEVYLNKYSTKKTK